MHQPVGGSAASKSYLGEFRQHWRATASVCAGMGAGFLLNHYIASIFAPHLLEEFNWPRADFAMIGSLGLLTLFVVPLAGRLTDLFGVRPVATVGVIVFPLTFVGYAMMPGDLMTYAAIFVVQNLLAGAITSSTVYSRLIAERFVTARGLAFAVAATSPAVIGMIGSPLLANYIDAHGWRAGYFAVAVYVAVVGALGILLMPGRLSPEQGASKRERSAGGDYRMVMKMRAFWLIFIGVLLANLIYPLQSSQMKLMLLEKGVAPDTAVWLISLFAAGAAVGRFACGIALDRLSPHIVSATALALPGLGLLTVAMGFTALPVMAGSVLLMGLSLGAESDLIAYLTSRYFPIRIYGTVIGLIVMAMALSSAIGSIVLGIVLKQADSFDPYMLLAGLLALAGGSLFLLLGREPALR